jgi:hypothetical protein
MFADLLNMLCKSAVIASDLGLMLPLLFLTATGAGLCYVL